MKFSYKYYWYQLISKWLFIHISQESDLFSVTLFKFENELEMVLLNLNKKRPYNRLILHIEEFKKVNFHLPLSKALT